MHHCHAHAHKPEILSPGVSIRDDVLTSQIVSLSEIHDVAQASFS